MTQLEQIANQEREWPRYASNPVCGFCDVCNALLPVPDEQDRIACNVCGVEAKVVKNDVNRVVSTAKSQHHVMNVRAIQQDRATVKETCPECSYEEMTFYTMQMRSSDEGQTVFYECLRCKYKFSLNN